MPGLIPTNSTLTPASMRSRSMSSYDLELQSDIMNWLFKEEPENYSFDALVKDKKAVWSGVRNPVAQKHLHAVRKGDRIFYYHTGKEKSVVGIAKALGNAYADPEDAAGKAAVVEVGPVKKLPRPVTLAEIKADASFKTFPLVRI